MIDNQLELARLQNRQVRGFRTLEDAAGVEADLTIRIQNVSSITHQPAGFGNLTKTSCHGNRMVRRQVGKLHAPAVEKRVVAEEEGIDTLAYKRREGGIDLGAGAGVENLD